MPCVGVSIGVERVFAIMEARAAAAGAAARRPPVSVLVASIPSKRRDMTVERMSACAALWAAGIDADMMLAADPKIGRQVRGKGQDGGAEGSGRLRFRTAVTRTPLNATSPRCPCPCPCCCQAEEAAKAGIPLMVVLGEDECERGEVSLKHMASGLQETMPRLGLVAAVKEALRRLEGGGGAAPALAQTPSPASAVASAAPPQGDAPPGGTASRPLDTAAAAASAPHGSGASGGGSVGTVVEGEGRAAGRFSRPAAPVSGV